MENHRNFSGNTVGNNAIVNQGNGNHIMVNVDNPNADKLFLQEISKTDPFYDKKRILTFKGPLLWDSFSWILGHHEFDQWRHKKDGGVLWIKGDPGKGKTMLLCGIIEDLERTSQSENLSYFFCQATDYRINTAAAVVGSLIRTLLKGHPALLSRIRESHEDGPKGQLDGANALFILCDIFETITNDPDLTDVICIVDALDECVKDCRHLLNLIIKTSGRVKWLLSSRNEKDIENGLDQVPQRLILELKQNAERISTSIDAYITHNIQAIKALKDDKQLQVKTFDILKSKAQGTFLWVSLVVEQLHKTDRWELEHVLEEMPKDLKSLYGLILDQIGKLGERGQEACHVLLSIITTAMRPLRLGELLVFINSHWKGSRHFKTTYALRDVRDMVKTCGSILSIRDDTVYFIHQSAKDHVVENAAERILPILHQHYKMFEASLDAISNVLKYDIYGLEDPAIHIDDIPLKDIDSDPLASIRYCCVFWVEHLVSAYQFEGFEHSKYLKDDERLHSFLKEKFLCWIESLSLIRSFYPQAEDALQKLNNLIEGYRVSGNIESETSQTPQLQRERETQGLRKFIVDAYRFVRGARSSAVFNQPLQLYFSAMCFEQDDCTMLDLDQDDCTILKTFGRTVREKFGPSPTLANVQEGISLTSPSVSCVHEQPVNRLDTSHFPVLVFSSDCSLIGQMSDNEFFPVLRLLRVDQSTFGGIFQINLGSKIALFPNSDEFISVSQDGIMKRWSIDKRSCIGEQSLGIEKYAKYNPQFISKVNPMGIVESLEETIIALSPMGDLVASWYRKTSDGLGLVRIWDTETACCRSSFESDEVPYLHAIFSPNSQLLALSFNAGIKMYNAKTGVKVKHLISRHEEERKSYISRTGKLEHAWFTPNSKVLVTLESECQFCLWDTHTWKLLHNIKISQRYQSLRYLAISPDSTLLATAFHEIILWSIDTGECVAEIPVSSSSMLPALQQQNKVTQIWFNFIYQTASRLQRKDPVFDSVTISPNSKFVASRHYYYSEVYVWSGEDGRLIHVLKGKLLGYKPAFEPLIFSPDSQLLAYVSSRGFSGIQIWCVTTGKSVRLLDCQDKALSTSVAFSGDGKHLVAGNFNGEISIWSIDSGQLTHKYALHDGSLKRTGILITSISQDSAYVAAFWDSRPSQARIWHLNTGKIVVINSNQTTRKAQVTFSSDSAILACISESMAQIFDVTTGACLHSFSLDGIEHPRLLSFDPINGRILTAKCAFYKTSSWKHWQTSPRLGYSYDYRPEDPRSELGEWILLDGKKNCYVPINFRPRLFEWPKSTTNVAMTDSLLATVTMSGGVALIKLPNRHGGTTASVGAFDISPAVQGIAGGADNSYSVAHVPATSDIDSSTNKRKRRESDELDIENRDDTLESWRGFRPATVTFDQTKRRVARSRSL
ncbi:hypothetical protein V8C43DRAFT_275615 [Trichoderma afarasin]